MFKFSIYTFQFPGYLVYIRQNKQANCLHSFHIWKHCSFKACIESSSLEKKNEK